MYKKLLVLLLALLVISPMDLSARKHPGKKAPEREWEVRARQGVRIEIGKDRDRRGRRDRRDRRDRWDRRDRYHPRYRYYRYHPRYRSTQPYYHDYYYSGYTVVAISYVVDVQKVDSSIRIRLDNGMLFQFEGSGPPLSGGQQVTVYRTARGDVGFSFGIGSGPFRFYYRDAKARDFRYYLKVGDYLYKVDRLE